MKRRMSRFQQIVASAPNAASRQRYLERKADQILRANGFYKPMDEAEKAIRQEAERYNLRAFLDPNRAS